MIEPIVKEMFFVCVLLVELIAAAILIGCFGYIVLNAALEIKDFIAKFQRVEGE
jgi:hypothetical protein